MSKRWITYWILVGLTIGLYQLMVAWSLPLIAAAAGGLTPFDMRPLGYDAEDVRAFLLAISDAGRVHYLTVQHRLDMAYPAMLAAVLGIGALGLAQGKLRPMGYLAAVFASVGAVADYVENFTVAGMLKAEFTAADLQSAELADLHSALDIGVSNAATLVKSGATTVAMVVVLVQIVIRVVSRLRRGSGAT